MFSKSKSWLPAALWRPKNPHSLEHLKYLYSVLCKNQTVTENNRSLLVETLRSISEILIWGDQHDSSVFDFFLEKNMLSFFLRYLRQKCGRYICVQLLQTLNILFENISNETSLYYLLSNNHINSIIVHKFDFSDEEVMAYYISFLKTLSLKLNKHTIHFFYNEHTNDFALYTEAIKFFNQHESMVRIAVRTITLNVYRVDDKAMLRYIRDRTAAPYFSNLVWFIGNHILDLDICVRNDADHQSRDRLADLVAEHLDHLHYLNDILSLNIDELNDVLVEHLLNRLLIPLYVYSLTKRKKYSNRQEGRKHVSSVVSLFLLSQVFLIISQVSLVRQLAEIIFQGNISLTRVDAREDSPKLKIREFSAPEETLEKTLEVNRARRHQILQMPNSDGEFEISIEGNSTFYTQAEAAVQVDDISSPSTGTEDAMSPSSEAISGDTDISSPNQNSTDEEKLLSSFGFGHRMGFSSTVDQRPVEFSLANRPYLEAIFNALECSENDYETLFALCLLYAMGHNEGTVNYLVTPDVSIIKSLGIHQGLLDTVLMTTERSDTKYHYNVILVEKLIKIITLACQPVAKVRLSTLELSIRLLKQLVYKSGHSFLQDCHLACVENARECSTQLLRNFYKSEEIFLDMFEDEYREMTICPLNVEYLTMDASILLPPTGTPLTGIAFNKRLPCGEVERARKAIRVFLLIRDLSLTLLTEEEKQLPLTKDEDCVKINNILDLKDAEVCLIKREDNSSTRFTFIKQNSDMPYLQWQLSANNSDLIACTVFIRERKQERRFLVIDSKQLILVEPDAKRLGWGVVRFVGFLQDVEVSGDKDDSRSLHITVHKQASSAYSRQVPYLSAKFVFDDHIRCMAAKQRLTKGRIKARQQKMQKIERLLDIPAQSTSTTPGGFFSKVIPGRSHPVRQNITHGQTLMTATVKKEKLASSNKNQLPFHQTSKTPAAESKKSGHQISGGQNKSSARPKHQEIEEGIDAVAFQSLNQPATKQQRHSVQGNTAGMNQVQEIPLEDMSKKSKRVRSARDQSYSFGGSHRADHSRSHSHSPRRVRSGSSQSSNSPDRRSNRSRSRSLASPASEKLVKGSVAINWSAKKSGQVPVLTVPARSRSESQSSSDGSPELQRGPLKELSRQSPKSLQPAHAPTLSLLLNEEATTITDELSSPKLVPPSDREKQGSKVMDAKDHSMAEAGCDSKEDLDSKLPSFTCVKTGTGDAHFETNCQQATPGVEGASPAVQLTRLAQMVQEHYRYPDNEGGKVQPPRVEQQPVPVVNQQDFT